MKDYGRIKLIQEDITKMEVDAIVNAANNSLLGGGGVDGAIHRAAGPELLERTRTLNGVETGQAKITPGYGLPATYIIHTAGPIYQSGNQFQSDLLASSYRTSLQLASIHHIKTIAFPSISTGVYGYPIKEASQIAIKTVKEELKTTEMAEIETVYFVVYNPEDYSMYAQQLENL